MEQSKIDNIMRSAIFITARMKSKRLPKKLLIPIKDKTVIEHLIDRLKLAKLPDLIILCTSTNSNDDVLAEIAKKNKIECFRGSEDDVLERFREAASLFSIDFIAVTWGDELFCDPEYIDKTIELFKKTNADFIKCDDLPLGAFNYGLKVEALKRVCQMKTEKDTEVWGNYFLKSNIFDVKTLEIDDEELKHPEIRITLDYPEDLELVKKIFDRLYIPGKVFTLREIIKLLKKEPQLAEINKGVQKSYEEHLKESAPAKIKKI